VTESGSRREAARRFAAHRDARSRGVALGFSGLVMVALLAAASPGHARSATMYGAIGVVNPEVAPPDQLDSRLGAFGKGWGVLPPTAGVRTIDAIGTTLITSAGRALALAAGRLNFQGADQRAFPAFPDVAQVTQTFMSVQPAATFMAGGGALAFCPGPGCNASGMGTAISFCPPLARDPLHPAPGTAMAPIGNWNCTFYPSAGPSIRGIRIAISNSPGAPHFGGTLRLLRSQRATIWRVLEAPSTPMAYGVVERAWRTGTAASVAGGENFGYATFPEQNGPHLLARLGAGGMVTATAGCANGVGTVGVGKTFMRPGLAGPYVPIIGPGNGCGTEPGPGAAGHAYGFRLTTGTISGSDFFPFLDATTMSGTPFNPRFQPRSFGQGLFFTRMGRDVLAGSGVAAVRNLAMIGGGIAYDPESGSAYFRLLDLRMGIFVPEPQGAAAPITGIAALVVATRMKARRRSPRTSEEIET